MMKFLNLKRKKREQIALEQIAQELRFIRKIVENHIVKLSLAKTEEKTRE